MVGGEGEQVGPFGGDQGRRFPHPVAGGDLDPGQDRAVAGLGVLQRRGELVAVQRHDPVVVVAGEDEGGRILRADLDLMQR